MRFWGSSAIVPLIAEEPASRTCRNLVRSDPDQAVWALTATEVLSALCRLRREGVIEPRTLALSEARLDRIAQR